MTKKILRIIARLNVGGPAIHVTNLNYYLDQTGNYVSTLVYGSLAEGEGSMEYKAIDKGLKTIVLPGLGREINFTKDLKTLIDLYRIIKQEKPDIVHTHTAKAGTVGRLAAILAGVPQIYHTFHGHVFHSYFGWLKTRIFILIEQLLARGTTKIIAISEKQKRELIDYGITKPHHIHVIPLGFELQTFAHNLELNYWHTKYNIPATIPLVGIIGRLVPVKNHELFLNIAKTVISAKPEVKFLIIGDGELRPELEQSVKNKGLTNNIIFTGFENDPRKIYSDLAIVALTSHNEGTPVTLIEALACGKPVISTNVGGVSDIIRHNTTGWLEKPEDAETFAKHIRMILDNYKAALVTAQAGQQEILKKYDVQRLAKDIHMLYQG